MATPRLHTELLFRLLWPLLAIVAATGALGTLAAHHLTDRVFDHWLMDATSSLANQVRFNGEQAALDLPQAAATMLLYDETDRTFFSVRQDGRTLAGSADLPAEGVDAQVYQRGRAFDVEFQGREMRVARVEVADASGHRAVVLVGETMAKRNQAERELLLMLLPTALLLVAAATSIHMAVRRTIGPLEAIAARWNLHSHASLQPIPTAGVPRELVPFASALNGLLERTRALLERERQFAANAAHQLRTPLAGLRLGLARAAQSDDLQATRQLLHELDATTRRTARLLQQMLAMGRLDTGLTVPLEFEAADLGALVHDVGSAFVDAALDQDIEIALKTPSQPVMAAVHRELLGEAIGNLLDNALRYASPGSHVEIEVLADPPRVRVADDGPGIPEAEQARVFERFARGQGAGGEGSGLGLAIVSSIAQLHGGSVELESSPGHGASFTLVLRDPR
jgi:two-component system sensor histidine kinase TctE